MRKLFFSPKNTLSSESLSKAPLLSRSVEQKFRIIERTPFLLITTLLFFYQASTEKYLSRKQNKEKYRDTRCVHQIIQQLSYLSFFVCFKMSVKSTLQKKRKIRRKSSKSASEFREIFVREKV
jgi:hypothetical protein